MKAGTNVPSYSGGLAATPLFWIWLFCSRIVSVSRTSTTAFLMRCSFRTGRRAYGMDGMATSGVVSAV